MQPSMYSAQPPGSIPAGLKGPPPAHNQQGLGMAGGQRIVQQAIPQGPATSIPAQRPQGHVAGMPAQPSGYAPMNMQGGTGPAPGMLRAPGSLPIGIAPGARPPMMVTPGTGLASIPPAQAPGALRPPMAGAAAGAHGGMRPAMQPAGPSMVPVRAAQPAMQPAGPGSAPVRAAQPAIPAGPIMVPARAAQPAMPPGQAAPLAMRPPAAAPVVGTLGPSMPPGQQGARVGASAEGPRYGRRAGTGNEPDRPTWPAGSTQVPSAIPGAPPPFAASGPTSSTAYRPTMSPASTGLPAQSVPPGRPAPVVGSPASIALPRPAQGGPGMNPAGWPASAQAPGQSVGAGLRPQQPSMPAPAQVTALASQPRGVSPAVAGLSQLKQAAATRLTQRVPSPNSTAAGPDASAWAPRPAQPQVQQPIQQQVQQPVQQQAQRPVQQQVQRPVQQLQRPAWNSDFMEPGNGSASSMQNSTAPPGPIPSTAARPGGPGIGAPVPVNLAAAANTNRSAALAALAARRASPSGGTRGASPAGSTSVAQAHQPAALSQAGMQQGYGQARRTTPPQQAQPVPRPNAVPQQLQPVRQPIAASQQQRPMQQANVAGSQWQQPLQSSMQALGSNGGFGNSMAGQDMEEHGSVGPLIACPSCGRNFAEQAYAKHAKICEKVFVQKRKAFNSAETRIAGTEAAKYFDARKGVPKSELRGGARPPAGAAHNAAGGGKMSKWKMQSEQLRAAMRNQRFIKEAQDAGQDIRSLKFEPTPEDIDDRVPCPYCGRKFAALTAERHIPKCKDTQAKPTFCKAQGGKGAYARMK